MQNSQFNINLIKNYIHVYIIVPVTFKLAISFTNNYTELGKKVGIYKVLIDLRNSTSKTSIFDKYTFAYKQAKLAGLSRKWKIALVKNSKDISPTFLESVMLNAGYQFKMFNDERAAKDWFEH